MALQNLCLNVLVENFERYYTAFSTSKDANLKRKFEFIQRVYSYELATQMYKECDVEEKYVDLLVNKYLKVLDTNWFNNCPWKTIVSKMAEVGPNIKKIYFHEYTEDRPWKEIFCYLPNLEVMHFVRGCVNEILFCIAKFCPNIIEIDIRSSFNVSEEGLRFLCRERNEKAPCPKLKKLYIRCCKVSDGVAKSLLRYLQFLEVFDYRDLPSVLYSMHKKNLSQLGKISQYNLSSLNLLLSDGSSDYTDILQVCLSLCPFITSLSCPVHEQHHLDLLCGLSRLEDLDLKCKSECYLDINNFLKSKGSKLISLTVRTCSLSVLTLAESCPSLKQLSMNTVSFQQHDGSIPLFHNLDTFFVEKAELDDNASNLKSVCLILSSSPKLQNISLGFCDLTSSEVKTEILKCFEHCFVKNIDFTTSSVYKQFVIDILLTCHSLKCFDLGGRELNSDDREEIYRCAEILPNNPEVFFNQLTDDYFDFCHMNCSCKDVDNREYYVDDYDDYIRDYDDYDEVYISPKFKY